MKKFIYTIVLLVVTTTALVSCTEQEIKPDATAKTSSGGGVSDPLSK